MRLLLVEDEKDLGQSIVKFLTNKETFCDWAENITDAQDFLIDKEYDCVLLDLMLKNEDGIEVLKFIKNNQRREGVIIISAKDSLETRLEGLHLGADDYLVKPFHLAELQARITAILRRKFFNGTNHIIIDNLTIDIDAKKLMVGEKEVVLTKKEFELLLYFIRNKNRVLSKESLAEHLSGDFAGVLDNHDFVYAHIKNLKNKLKKEGAERYIKSVYGLGYKWVEDEKTTA